MAALRYVEVRTSAIELSERFASVERTPSAAYYPDKHYAISAEELEWLGARVEALGRIVAAICAERIAALEETAQATK